MRNPLQRVFQGRRVQPVLAGLPPKQAPVPSFPPALVWREARSQGSLSPACARAVRGTHTPHSPQRTAVATASQWSSSCTKILLVLYRIVLKIHEICREWHFWMRLRCLEHLHREITLEQHQLSVPASLFLSSRFDVQEAAELEAVSHQPLPRAPLLDLATTSPGAAPTLQNSL